MENMAKGVAKRVVKSSVNKAAVPTVVKIAQVVGAEASTGTAIGSLSGAAATSATLASVGSGASAALGAVGIAVAPAAAGAAIVGAVAYGIGSAICSIFD